MKVLANHGIESILDKVIPIILTFPGVSRAGIFLRDNNGWVYRDNTGGTRNLENPDSPLVLQCLEENRMVKTADGKEYTVPLSFEGENLGALYMTADGCLTDQVLDEVQQFCYCIATFVRHDRERCVTRFSASRS